MRGPYEILDGMTFYLVNRDGADFLLDLTYRADRHRRHSPRPLLIRVLDPEESLVERRFIAGDRIDAEPMPTEKVSLSILSRGAGVYQVIVSGFGGQVDLATQPALQFGVLGHTHWLCGRGDQYDGAYVYLPPGLGAWPVKCTGEVEAIVIRDAQGRPRLKLAGRDPSGTVALPRGEQVWRFSARGGKHPYKLNFGGHPIILCPDADTARAIRASVDVLPDGAVCFHKFQVRAQALLERYRRLPAGDYSVRPPSLEQYRQEWLKEPARSARLFGPYGLYANLPATLYEQNVDPQSPWFGMIYVWHCREGQPLAGSPFTTYDRLGERLQPSCYWVDNLALAYALDEPFNPLHKSPALLNRVIVASLQNLMRIGEHECDETNPNLYCGGGRAFRMEALLRAYRPVIGDCPDDVREVWTEGLRRLVDRFTVSEVATSTNQWSFIWSAFADFHFGTGEQWYADVLRGHIRWMISGAMQGLGQAEAGYMTESGGPDATYNGITLHHLAGLYHELRDPAIRESMRRCYDLLNHTVAPEPNGTWLGASDFCCRTPGDWTRPQFGAGLSTMADDLLEAGVRGSERPVWIHGPKESDEAARRDQSSFLRYNPATYAREDPWNFAKIINGIIPYRTYRDFPARFVPGRLPARADKPFARSFGNGEFVCVRRLAYYALIYTGSPMCSWLQQPDDANAQWPRNGGGISLFWSPELGTSILGKNYNTYSAHTLIAEPADSGPRWEDYRSVKGKVESDPPQVDVTGRIRGLPLSYRRTWRFGDDRLVATLTINAEEDVRLRSFAESFPYPLKAADPLGVKSLDCAGSGAAQAVQFAGPAGDAHVLAFGRPRHCDVGVHTSVDNYKNTRRYGRVLTALPARWHAGQERTFRYCIVPMATADSRGALPSLVASLLGDNLLQAKE